MNKFSSLGMLIIFCFSLTACANTAVSPDIKLSAETAVPQKSLENNHTTSHVSTTSPTKETDSKNYAGDTVVNQFITQFNENTKFKISEIKKGNTRIKYSGKANDCYIEMINATESSSGCFSLSIHGGQEIDQQERMFDVFVEAVRILDPTLNEDNCHEIVNSLKSEQYMISDYKINDRITIKTYVPIIELSKGKTACRIDINAYDYN